MALLLPDLIDTLSIIIWRYYIYCCVINLAMK